MTTFPQRGAGGQSLGPAVPGVDWIVRDQESAHTLADAISAVLILILIVGGIAEIVVLATGTLELAVPLLVGLIGVSLCLKWFEKVLRLLVAISVDLHEARRSSATGPKT